MNLTKIAITNNRVTLILFLLLFFGGISAYINLPKAQDPGFTVRTAVITTQFPGASPKRVEQLITAKLEKKVQEMPEVDSITSNSRSGISIINVNFKESYTEMRPIFDDLRRKISDISQSLPDGSQAPFINDEFGDVFGTVYGLSAEGYTAAELKQVADEIKDVLLIEPDIAKVSIHGVQNEVVFVEYNNAKLTELGINPRLLGQSLSEVNVVASGGSILSGRERITLEPTGSFESVEDLKKTVIQSPGGGLLYLGDIVDVYRGYTDPPSEISKINGEAAIVIAVALRKGGDILKLGKRLDEIMPGIEASFPWGVSIEKVWSQPALVKKSVDDFVSNLFQAVVIVILVMVAFLGLRTGMVVAVLIPATMIITFYIMDLLSLTINQVSLAALIISLGLLVDNAIVMVESVLVKLQQGKPPIDAAIESGQELKAPLLVSSLTTAAAFMPIAFAESAIGEYTADIFYVVAISLLTSWLLAMTITPLLTMYALKVTPSEKPEITTLQKFYLSLLTLALKQKAAALGLTVLVFFAAMWGLGKVPQVFIPPSEDPVVTSTLKLPLGTDIQVTAEMVQALDDFVKTELMPDQITNWLGFIGEGGPRFALNLNPPNPNPANAFLIFNTVNSEVVDETIAKLNQFVFTNYPDANAQISRLENGPPVGYPIIIRINGKLLDPMLRIAGEVTKQLYTMDGVLSVTNTWGFPTKKIIVEVDQERAKRSGVTSNDVAYSLRTGLTGVVMTQYREGEDVIPVTLRTVASDRHDIDKLYGLSIHSQATGKSVPLTQVADVKLDFESGLIEHRNRVRTLSLKVQLKPGVTATEVNDRFLPWLDEQQIQWPSGYGYALGGESEESGKANQSIADKLPMALMAILLLLVIQFNSIRKPIIVLTTIPLGLIGVTLGLLIARSSFGFFAILGIISLAGIIINNAIVLLDRIRIEREDLGRPHFDAIVQACLQRFRPILLTTGTTVLGMLPLWWGGGAMFQPMAITIIFGLAFATVLTLLVVPILYSLLYRVTEDS